MWVQSEICSIGSERGMRLKRKVVEMYKGDGPPAGDHCKMVIWG